MQEIALFEAKNKLCSLLDQVAAGESFVITRHGQPVACLTPVEHGFDQTRARQAVSSLRKASQKLSLGGISVSELINEGRL